MKKYFYTSAIAVLLIGVLITCKKDVETPSGSNKIDVGQTLADSVSYFYSQIKTTITDLNGNAIKEHGHCWSTIQKPTIEGNRSQLGELNQAATFASELNDLEDNTKYYVRYYLTLENGTVYGEDMQFSTLKAGVPDVEISAVSEIDLYSGKFQGTVLADSGAAVQSKGFCWHTQENFSIDDCLDTTVNGSGLGAFSSQISNLSEGTTYYVKSYAINQKGISYSQVQSFITVAITVPGLRTINVENITNNQATVHAEVLNNGLGSITARGVCWHTQPNFNLDNNSGFNLEEGGLGEFSSLITNLNANTTYYAKAFATNEKGTAYGEVLEFKTSPVSIPQVSTKKVTGISINSADCGGIIDSDGYSSVTARGVVWSTLENPTIENNAGITSDGQGMGAFSSHLTNLTYGTSYFVRAYAVNIIGVAYGEQKSFETLGIGFPALTTNNVTNITATTAQCGGNISSAGNGSIIARGICWNTTDNPTLENNINFTTNGTGVGGFTSQMTGLTEGIQYYVAAYATNEQGTTYGSVKSFTTTDLSAPTVTTSTATNITANSAVAGGNVTNNGNLNVTQRGVCWHTNPNPTIENNLGHTSDGSGTGSFVSNINNLTEGQTYYYRAYAINSQGTGYGLIKEFTTLNLGMPTVSTNSITNIGTTYATGGGNVTNDGNSSVTARGVCWNTTGNPTLQNNLGYTTNGSGTGTFTSSLTGLNENTTYYVAAYATNSEGTAYGSIKSFTTLNISLPTVTTTTPTNITINSATSGGNVTSDGGTTVTSRGVCWNTTGNPTLQNNLGYTTNGSGTGTFTSSLTGLNENTTYYVAAYATNSEGTAYGSIKIFTTLNFGLPTVTTTTPSNITTNSAISGGNVSSDGGTTVTSRGVCWNTNGNPTLQNNLGYTTNGSGTGTFTSSLTGLNENTTYYVAAFATNSEGTAYGSIKIFTTLNLGLHTVTTTTPSNITTNSAISGGNISSDGGTTVTSRGVCWNTNGNPTLQNNLGYTTNGSGTGSFTSNLTNLNENTTYYIAAYATNSEGTAYGSVISFQTLSPPCGGETSFYYEGQTYNIVEIGSQCWMAENLNVGIRINGIQEMTNNSVIEKYCYNDYESNCDQYGGLYQWDEIMQYTTQEGVQGICPDGWHIPTDEEWKNMEMALGMSQSEADNIGWRGTNEGEKLKSTSGWNNNGNGTNSSGFDALPGGGRYGNGPFGDFGNYGLWWSATVYSGTHIWIHYLNSETDQVGRGYGYKTDGYSVRCIRD